MANDVEQVLINRIRKIRRGVPFFAADFALYGNAAEIRSTLTKLAKSEEVTRVGRGIYVRPKFDDVIGLLTPCIDEIAYAIARRDRARIAPTGVYALNAIGLSTQVPMNVIYLTDGTGRKLKIGNRTLRFIRTTPKNVAAIGQTSHLVIQALRSIGKDNMTEDIMKQITKVLKHEEPHNVLHDMKLAPNWIREIIKLTLE
jgi:hypothetical protein